MLFNLHILLFCFQKVRWKLFLIGNDIKYAKVKNAKYFKTNKEGIKYIKNIMKENTDILIKASNGMNFKTIVEELQK